MTKLLIFVDNKPFSEHKYAKPTEAYNAAYCILNCLNEDSHYPHKSIVRNKAKMPPGKLTFKIANM